MKSDNCELKNGYHSALMKLGYELLPGFGYYKAHLERKTWAETVAACEQEGTHLLILNSAEEARELGRFMKKHGIENHDIFVGAHDRYTEGNWVTLFSKLCTHITLTKILFIVC